MGMQDRVLNPFYAPKTYAFPPPALYGHSKETPRFMREAFAGSLLCLLPT